MLLLFESTDAPHLRNMRGRNFQKSLIFRGGKLVDVTAVRKEYERLLALFKDVDETKTKLVDELLHKAAFLKVQLDEL